MAYSWLAITASGEMDAAQMNQVKTHANTFAAKISVSLTWSNLDVTADVSMIDKDQILECRSEIDYLDDQNYCRTHNTTKYSTIYNPRYATVNSGKNTVYYGTKYVTKHTTANVTVVL